MNKKITILILIVALILIGGLVLFSYSFIAGFTTEVNNYTGNGVSFNYPADYKITEVKGNSTFLIAKNTKNPNLTFQVSKSPVNGTAYNGTSLDEYAKTLVNDFKSRGWTTFTNNDTIFLDNSSKEYQSYSIGYTEKLQPDSDSVNGKITIFDKNGMRYAIDFQGKGKHSYDSWGYIRVTTSFIVYGLVSISNVTYSNGVLFFTYPENWENITPGGNTLLNRDWVVLFSVSEPRYGDAIYLQKNENLKNYTPEQLVNEYIGSLNMGDKSLSHTSLTINGIQMSKSISKIYGNTGELRYIDVYFQDKNKVMYNFQFITTPKNFENTNKIAENVINSIQMR